jgi:hypothetical protein
MFSARREEGSLANREHDAVDVEAGRRAPRRAAAAAAARRNAACELVIAAAARGRLFEPSGRTTTRGSLRSRLIQAPGGEGGEPKM